jgi:hypothetical protein
MDDSAQMQRMYNEDRAYYQRLAHAGAVTMGDGNMPGIAGYAKGDHAPIVVSHSTAEHATTRIHTTFIRALTHILFAGHHILTSH